MKIQRKHILLILILLFFIIAIIFVVVSQKETDKMTSLTKGKWEKIVSIEAKEKLTIGSETTDDFNYMFGPIGDIKIDNQGFIYILDPSNHRIQKFSKDGRFLKTYGGKKGQGPGEFLRPRKLAIDSQNRLYVTDSDLLRITVFNQDGTLDKTIKALVRLWDIEVGNDQQIYVTSLGDPGKYRIYQYDYKSGKLVQKFCERKKETDMVTRAGAAGTICLDPVGNIYYCFCYPYEIRKYSPDGQLLGRFNRVIKDLKRPSAPLGPVILYTNIKGICYLPDGKFLTIIWKINNFKKKDWYHFFDVFDKNGEWLFTFPATTINMNWFRVMAVDREGNLYYDRYNPFPHLKKYLLKFTKKVK